MKTRTHTRRGVAVNSGLAVLMLGATVAPVATAVSASAATTSDSDVEVVNTETVQSYADATGTVEHEPALRAARTHR